MGTPWGWGWCREWEVPATTRVTAVAVMSTRARGPAEDGAAGGGGAAGAVAAEAVATTGDLRLVISVHAAGLRGLEGHGLVANARPIDSYFEDVGEAAWAWRLRCVGCGWGAMGGGRGARGQ